MDQNGHNWIILDQNGSNWIILDQIGSNWSWQTWSWQNGLDKHGFDKHDMILTNMVLTNMALTNMTWSWQIWSWQTCSWQISHDLDKHDMFLTNMSWSWHGLNLILNISNRGLRFDSQSCFLWNDLIFTHMQTHQKFLILGRSKIFEDFHKMSDEKRRLSITSMTASKCSVKKVDLKILLIIILLQNTKLQNL